MVTINGKNVAADGQTLAVWLASAGFDAARVASDLR